MRYSLSLLLAILPATFAITLDLTSDTSIKEAASTVAYRMMTYYVGNESGQIPGELPQSPVEYYWWECGEMFMSLIDYWHYTNDTTYNDVVSQGMLFQVGTDDDFEPTNQTKDLGNDDQVFWGFAAMTAAEYNFPNPPSDQPQWLALAQAVFNTQAPRWDTTSCGGGLKWQIFSFNAGYDYKNSPSNFGLFNLASRLGAYTKNSTYTDFAEKIWNWTSTIGLISDEYHVWDGTDDTLNCTEFDHVEWTYSAGMALHGAAVMYSITNSSVWETRVNGLWNVSKSVFFSTVTPKVMTEVACEANSPVNCDTDQLSFKATYSRFLAAATVYAPWIQDEVLEYLAASATGAAAQCIGTPGGDSCGTLWYNNGTWDGTYGVGQQMSVMQVITANLVKTVSVPVSNTTGGTSVGNSAAGTDDTDDDDTTDDTTITGADKAGAGIITTIIILLTLGVVYWGLSDEMSSRMPLRKRH